MLGGLHPRSPRRDSTSNEKRRINECPNLDLAINKEEPGIHQQDDSGAGTCLRLRLGELRTTSGRAIVTERTPPRRDGHRCESL